MAYIRRSSQRGSVNLGWLTSRHSFSFGHYYDPAHQGFSALRVINDDIVDANRGFDTHGHQDMEIISYVIDGELEHRDNQGNRAVIPAGDIQRMSAGTGILHSEFNPSTSDPVNFLQIWIMPKEKGIAPSYAQKRIVQTGALTEIVTPEGSDSAVSVNQDMTLSRLILSEAETVTLNLNKRVGYLHLIKGQIQHGDTLLNAGDGYGISTSGATNLKALDDTEALWFDLPAM